MRIVLPYGKSQVEVDVANESVIAVATPPKPIIAADDESAEVLRALENPIGSPQLRDLARGKSNVAIVVSDYTRPTPSGKLVSHLLRELEAGGIPPSRVSVVFAAGTHRPTTPEEMRSILGEEVYSRVNTLSSDCDDPDMVYVGETSLNHTPVWTNRVVAEADLRISVSGIEPHHSAGWSGSAKNILPGVCGRKTVMAHHSMSNRPEVRIGVLEGNPFREDLEQATALVGLDFVLSVILTDKKQVSRAFAGHWIESHRAGVRAADEMISFYLPEPADIVLASVGGAPRDSNFWQTEGKGFTRIPSAVRDGGVIVMVAECTQGVGHAEFAEALLGGTADEIVEKFKYAEFTVFGNKAFRLATLLKRTNIFLVSSGLKEEHLGQLPVRLFADAQSALAAAFDKLGNSARVLVVPRTPGVLLRARSTSKAGG
jgi:lactate racemase